MRLPSLLEATVDWIRYDLPTKLDRLPRPHRRALLGGLGLVVAAAVAWAIAAGPFSGEDEPQSETRVVTVAVESDEPAEAPVGPLGFPLVATRNTTRVGGPDPAADAAATALATHPPAANAKPVEAVVLVGADDPYAGIAASVLAGPPLRAPILIGEPEGLPGVTADALAKLDPRGSGPADAAVYRIGAVATSPDFETETVEGDSAAEIAGSIARLRERVLKERPQHILIASSEQAPYAMPAAAWAARSGDPVLFSGRTAVPRATLDALRRHRGVPVYVLGPQSVISEDAVRTLRRTGAPVRRVGADGPVANSIAFARYVDGSFGWNINDPGHGLVIASSSRPLDAAAAASLSASGKWGPLVVIEGPGSLTAELRSFLLDIKPGFEDDPTRAVYNHVWLIGDTAAIGARVQAEIDELAELTEIGPGAGGPVTEGGVTDSEPGLPLPGAPEPEAEPKQGGKRKP